MVHFILSFAIGALGLWVASVIVPGFKIRGAGSLVLATALLGLADAIVRPVLSFLTFPLIFLTLGLFLLVINGLMVGLVAVLLKGVEVKGFLAAMMVAVVTGVISWIGQSVLGL